MNAKERQKQDEMQKKGKSKENEKSQAFKDNWSEFAPFKFPYSFIVHVILKVPFYIYLTLKY